MKRSRLQALVLFLGLMLIGVNSSYAAGPTTVNTILNGSGKPSAGLGKNGDFYIDVTNLMFYGPKKSNKWPAGISLRVVSTSSASVSASGVTGEKGERGPVGPTGPRGEKGDVGPSGPAGAQGPAGETGPAGATGPKGDTGAAGAAGAAGPKGDTGLTGATGPAGSKGDKGDTGATGPAGSAGATGPQGPKGDTGATGAAGAAGVVHGYYGTVTGSITGTSVVIPGVASLPGGKKYLFQITFRGRTQSLTLDMTRHLGISVTPTGATVLESDWTVNNSYTVFNGTEYEEHQWTYRATLDATSLTSLSITLRTSGPDFGTAAPLEITGKFFATEFASVSN